MQRVPVDSSRIASIGYAPEPQVLELEFRQSGEVYRYFDVPAEEHMAFLAADSKGAYLNVHFKPKITVIIEFGPNPNSSGDPYDEASIYSSVDNLSNTSLA